MNTLQKIANHFSIPLVEAHGTINDIASFLEKSRKLEGVEGFIIRFEDGTMFKIKCEEYLILHKAVSALSQEKDVIRLILDNKSDDLKAALADDLRDEVIEFENRLISNIEATADRLRWEVVAWVDNHGDGQKKFAVEFVNGKDSKFAKNEKSLLFRMFNGGDVVDDGQALEFVIDYIKNQCGTGTKVEACRDMFGGIRWTPKGIDA